MAIPTMTVSRHLEPLMCFVPLPDRANRPASTPASTRGLRDAAKHATQRYAALDRNNCTQPVVIALCSTPSLFAADIIACTTSGTHLVRSPSAPLLGGPCPHPPWSSLILPRRPPNPLSSLSASPRALLGFHLFLPSHSRKPSPSLRSQTSCAGSC